jgi:hypothetical protein
LMVKFIWCGIERNFCIGRCVCCWSVHILSNVSWGDRRRTLFFQKDLLAVLDCSFWVLVFVGKNPLLVA